MTEEELRLKLGLDTAELDSGSKRALDNISNFGRESHKSFIHGDSAARGFKKTIHELSDQVPVLGSLLRIAINPIGGTFMAAAGAIAFATKAIESFNEKLAKTGEINAKGSGERAESPMSLFIKGEKAVKESAEANAEGKPTFTPVQKLARDQAIHHAESAAKVIGDKIAGDESNKTRDPATMSWMDPGSYVDLFHGAALSISKHGWRSLLKPGAVRKALEEQNTEEANTAAHNETLKSKVEDAKLILQNSEPQVAPTPMGKGNLFKLFGIDAIRTMKLADLAKKGAFDTPKIQLDEAGGVAYKPLPGAPGYIPAGAAQTPNTNPGLTRMDLIVRSLQRIEQDGLTVVGKDQ